MSQSLGTDDFVSAAIEKYADMVRRICFLYLRNEADVDDVFQEVFLKFCLRWNSFENENYQKAWLCRVTFNQCKDLCKSYWRKNVVSMDEMEIPYENPEQGWLMNAILSLPPDYKELVYLHYYEGRPITEVADMMQKNMNTAYSMLRRAKEQLKKKVRAME